MPDPREPYGRLVHDTRLACEAGRAAAEGRQRFNMPPWEGRDEGQRELDMRIGAAVAAAERERIRQLAIRHEATYRPEDPDLPGITGDPDMTKPGPDPLGDPFAGLIGESQERSDEKEAGNG